MSPSGTIGRPYRQRSCPTAKRLETTAQAFQAWAVLLNRFAVRERSNRAKFLPAFGALSFSIRNLSFFLAETDFFREGFRGDSNIEKRKVAQIGGVPLDYLGFILLTVRNKTKSPFPQKGLYVVRSQFAAFPIASAFLEGGH
jgi:hypothetical protein